MHRLSNTPELDFNAAVTFIKEHIEMERQAIEAHKVLKNETEYLLSEYRVTHCELLLALLYRARPEF